MVCGMMGKIHPTIGNGVSQWKTVESTRHHVMRGGHRPPTQHGGHHLWHRATFRGSHYGAARGFYNAIAHYGNPFRSVGSNFPTMPHTLNRTPLAATWILCQSGPQL